MAWRFLGDLTDLDEGGVEGIVSNVRAALQFMMSLCPKGDSTRSLPDLQLPRIAHSALNQNNYYT